MNLKINKPLTQASQCTRLKVQKEVHFSYCNVTFIQLKYLICNTTDILSIIYWHLNDIH